LSDGPGENIASWKDGVKTKEPTPDLSNIKLNETAEFA